MGAEYQDEPSLSGVVALRASLGHWKAVAYFLVMVTFDVVFASILAYEYFVRPGGPGFGSIGSWILLVFFAAGSLAFLPGVLRTRAVASLHVDVDGVTFYRGRRGVVVRWAEVSRIRAGLRRVRIWKVSTIGYAISISAMKDGSRVSVEVNDVEYKVPRPHLVSFAEKLMQLARRRGIPAEEPTNTEW